MALQCRVVLNENNEIDYVETEDGQRSQLFDGLVETLGGDKNSALGFYALTESEDFKTAQKAKKTESPAYSIAKVYKDRLTKEKQNNPSQYWSVDIPSDEVIKDSVSQGIPQFQKALSQVGVDMIVNGFVVKEYPNNSKILDILIAKNIIEKVC